MDDDIFFGEKFKVYDFINHSCYKIHSNSMIEALNYMKPFLKQNIMPSETEIIHFITENGGELIIDRMKDLYTYINKNDYFRRKQFNGFISLDKYLEFKCIEEYVNEEDNIIIFVYAQNIKDISHIKHRNRIYTF
jgi:hypothetical protein